MRSQAIAICLVFALDCWAGAANPTYTLHPDDAEALRAAGISVKHEVLNGRDYPDNPHHAFTITAAVPKGRDSLDASLWIGNVQGLVAHSSWESVDGKCATAFMLGEQTLAGATFQVQMYIGERSGAFSASGRYNLKLAEFAGVKDAAADEDGFHFVAPIKRDGPKLRAHIKSKGVSGNYVYDIHLSVAGGADQHFEHRSDEPMTAYDVRFADINGDGFRDVMVAGGTGDRGTDSYKTLLYDDDKREFRWLGD